jgi:hypothetical protein
MIPLIIFLIIILFHNDNIMKNYHYGTTDYLSQCKYMLYLFYYVSGVKIYE